MADLMEQGAAWLASQHANNSSRAVAYSRGQSSVLLHAALGRTSFDIDTAFGIERLESRDYLIRAFDLKLGGVAVLPAPGDVITEMSDGVAYTYEVLAPGNSPCYSMDAYRQSMRIHTKQTGVA